MKGHGKAIAISAVTTLVILAIVGRSATLKSWVMGG